MQFFNVLLSCVFPVERSMEQEMVSVVFLHKHSKTTKISCILACLSRTGSIAYFFRQYGYYYTGRLYSCRNYGYFASQVHHYTFSPGWSMEPESPISFCVFKMHAHKPSSFALDYAIK